MEKELIRREIQEIVSRVWDLSLASEIELLNGTEVRFSDKKLISVDISGAWKGEIVIQLEPALANEIASRMFQLEQKQSPSSDQEQDCLREIANMIAGNLKSALPEPCVLGLPQLSVDESLLRAEDLLLEVPFECRESKMLIAIYKDSTVTS